MVAGANGLHMLSQWTFGVFLNCARTVSQFTDADWDAWRWVTVRAPHAGESESLFWDVAALRTADTLVLHTPRVGFMTTPAFLANWPTNTSNQARVTTNQTMIVALGLAFDDRGVTVPLQSSGDDAAHAQPGTTCYACHQTLDPMRDFFRQSYTYGYGRRPDSAQTGIPTVASFSVLGSTPVEGNGIVALANAIAQHPRFAIAWTQKLCRFANSISCDETDPEFLRVAALFAASNHDFKTLVRELFSSPLVTGATPTPSTLKQGIVVSIARKDALCLSLQNRLGLGDVCGLVGTAPSAKLGQLVSAIPGDGYSRGAEEPLIPTDPNLFFQSAVDNLCVLLSTTLVKQDPSAHYPVAQPDAALDDFVKTVMGVPTNDPRSPPLREVLRRHYDDALTAGELPGDALRSTFVTACSSPLSVSSGL